MKSIQLGKTFQDIYLNTEIGTLGSTEHQGLITLSREKTNYGYKIIQGTNFISIHKTRLEIFNDGRAKAVTKVDKNYQAPYQITRYFNKQGQEIIGQNVRQELAYWKATK